MIRFIFLGLALVCFTAQVSALERVRFATDWKAQAEQGGFYQAQALGFYEQAGLDVQIIGGGAGVNIPQLLGAKAIEFGMGSNNFIPFTMLAAGVPAQAVMAAFQKDPQVLITHRRNDIKSLADMRGKPIMIADATRNSFWLWLKSQYGFSDKQIRKYTFNLAPFLVDTNAIQQGYITSEPYSIQKAGREAQVFLLADYNFTGYAAMVLAHNDLIASRPDIVRAFVQASIKGWQSYLFDNPRAGNRLILAANPDMTQDRLDFAIKEIRTRALAGNKNDIGTMDEARWQNFYQTMAAQGAFPKNLNWRNAFTLTFIE
ncbi:MAG: ABC transporter substrate-binding protein [Alphaproteobacteria bacterium]|nr:ABC transporter substrate-binding protein [Alphaproteobacteria bacterium]MBE8220705.1 ABC transporter substrate-binding protein [Alphaproteobacteria bacterium]